MPVEIVIGFVLLGVFQIAQGLGPTVSNTVGLCVQIALPPLGLFPGGSEIYNVSHYASRW
jgi:hypothetical protein